MSIAQRMEEHQEEIAKISQNVQELMAKCPSGVELMESSANMAISPEMQNLMQVIDNPNIGDRDKYLMGKYMGQMLQDDQETGLVNYANYLKNVAADPNYADRSSYFIAIADAALKLNESPSFRTYVSKYHQFEKDTSEEAQATRKAMEHMSLKMREWVDEENI